MAYKGYLVDLDGTIYRGNEIIPAGKRFVERLQQASLPFLFVTNNTTKTSQTVAKRLEVEFEIRVQPETVYTASYATLDHMKETKRGNRVFIIGEAGLKNVLLDGGFIWEEESPDFVVVGLDSQVTYKDLEIATLAIRKGALFIGTNPDKNLPSERGLIPGAGSFIALLETATNVEAVIIGKPQAIIMNKAVDILGLDKKEVLMVGDNYETDISAGIHNNIDTLLVLSGFTPRTAVDTLPEAPTYIVDSLDDWSLE